MDVNCWFSNLSQTSAPISRESVRPGKHGVRCTASAMLSAARRMSAMPIMSD